MGGEGSMFAVAVGGLQVCGERGVRRWGVEAQARGSSSQHSPGVGIGNLSIGRSPSPSSSSKAAVVCSQMRRRRVQEMGRWGRGPGPRVHGLESGVRPGGSRAPVVQSRGAVLLQGVLVRRLGDAVVQRDLVRLAAAAAAAAAAVAPSSGPETHGSRWTGSEVGNGRLRRDL